MALHFGAMSLSAVCDCGTPQLQLLHFAKYTEEKKFSNIL